MWANEVKVKELHLKDAARRDGVDGVLFFPSFFIFGKDYPFGETEQRANEGRLICCSCIRLRPG